MAAAKAGGAVKTVKAAPARGGFGVGLVVGLLIGLAVALGVALYITKAPIPFVNKLPQRTAEQDAAEAERNKNWDPNAPLAGKGAAPRAAASGTGDAPRAEAGQPAPAVPATPPATPGGGAGATPHGAPAVANTPAPPATPAAAASTATARAAASAPGRDPAAILAGQNGTAPAAKPAMFFVQAGAYSNPDDAEAQRARLAMSGFMAKVMAREQSGKTVYRVRLGPFDERDTADDLRDKLGAAGVESTLVRVER